MMSRLAAVALIALASAAWADAPAPTNGIKIGEGRLHPYLSVEGKYDSAAGYYGPTATLAGDIVITPTAGLSFDLDTPNTMVKFDGNGQYVWYTGLISSGAKEQSRVQAGLSLDTAFNRTGAVEFQIGDNLSRSDRTNNPAAGIGVLSLFNSVHAGVPIHPGGGAITVTPRLQWDVEFFSPLLPGIPPGCNPTDITCNPTRVSDMNYSNLNADLNGKWKFLPKTALMLDASFDYRTYFNNQVATPSPGTGNIPSELLKIQGGVTGLITSHISVLLMVGGGGDWGGSGAKTVIGQAEVAYLGSIVNARGGYLRGMQPVPSLGTFAQDRGYAEVSAGLLSQRLRLRLFGAIDYLSYFSATGRHDTIGSGEASIGYQIFSWWSVALAYNLTARLSTASVSSINYVRHEPRLTLTFSY